MLQNTAESGVDFVRNQIIMQTMGPDGLGYLPYLTALFFFIFFSNITEIIPFVQFPANARVRDPVGARAAHLGDLQRRGHQEAGPGPLLRELDVPAGRAEAAILYTWSSPIEFLSMFIVRPFSLAVRLFANMLAGHLHPRHVRGAHGRAVASEGITVVIAAVLVRAAGRDDRASRSWSSFLQAFIFTILTAVYIGGCMHPEH